MSLVLNTNLASINAQRSMNSTQSATKTAMERLSSGLRINSAKDDAAGLAIGSKMESQVRGMSAAIRNANDGVSMLQTADGGLQTISDIYQRMRELSTQASTGTYDTSDYDQLDTEYQQLSSEVTRIAGSTKFNGIAVIGAKAGTFSLQVGANSGETLDVTTGDATGYLATPGDLKSAANAKTAMDALDTAIGSLNTDRAKYGAGLNRLDFTIKNLETSSENQSAARSRIMDADYSQESAVLAKQQVLQQAGLAMLSQANQQPQQILSLLR
jgi:flagellin